jgi:negative regulator of sigma E activity
MDHAEVRELLELASVEPGGLDRLTGGGAPESEALAAHLRECSECRTELEGLRGAAATIRDAIRGTPTPDLRERTLAHIASAGRLQPGAVPPMVATQETARTGAAQVPSAWASRLTAVVAAAAVILGFVVWTQIDARLSAADAAAAEQQRSIAGLTYTASWALRVGSAADAVAIRLASSGGQEPTGTVLYSAERGELLVVANGLPDAPAGHEYRCWMDEGSGREPIGKMYVAGAVAYWGGDLDQLLGAGDRLAFGVSLVEVASTGLAGQVVLEGSSP